ncbi:protein kinase-like protein [Actinocorallia herbida]|uniref:non-specific serine/threonine protein kinase n=1 Tax=Actinocorallia herbida TaxID=58109 RepID=A0A3N1DC01_9ACTN|nr:WD40 repeat domain-containing serine/threonine-protein kinase [Actinocorallia herbida]ROO91039.1 protein kinase-like protein [Actinocorallia herbida]
MVAPLLPADPRHLGPYWLAGRLGAGGQGVVYVGYDADGVRVAVKALHAATVSGADRVHLRKEAAALGKVASFCTARVIESDFDHTPPYLVSEFVAGPDLQGRVEREGSFTPDALRRLGIGIATALTAVHAAGVIHRDLKPANVLLGPDGPRVIDFGIARTEEMSQSATGLKGTPRWMAPELFRGERATEAVDVWAWGAIMLYAATARPLVAGDSLPSIIHGVLNAEPELHPLPPSLRPLVESALNQDPEKRPSARALLDGLIADGTSEGGALEAGQKAASSLPAPPPAPSLGDLAEHAYTGLDSEARSAVPRVLLRMVGTTPSTFRTVPRAALQDAETAPPALDRAIGALAAAGLVVEDGRGLGLATPALVRAWPRLRSWAAEEGDALVAHQGLADAARRWDEHGRRSGDLLQGTSLDEAVTGTVAGRRHLTLSLLERAYLDGSVAGARRRARIRGLLSATLGILLLVASGTAAFAVAQSRDLAQRNITVSLQRDEAVGSGLAAAAVSLRRIDPVTAQRLAVAAASLAPDAPESRSALITLYHQRERDSFAPSGFDTLRGTSYSSDGRLLAYADAAGVKVLDIDARKVVAAFPVAGTPIRYDSSSLSLSGDGKVVSVLHEDGLVEFYDVATGKPRPRTFTVPEPFVEINGDGTRMLSMQRDRTLVRNTLTGETVVERPYPLNVAYLTRGGNLVGARKAALEAWNAGTGERIKLPRLDLGGAPISDLAVSPDGKLLVLEQDHAALWVVNWEKEEIRNLTIPKSEVSGLLSFSPDSRYLSRGDTVWDLTGMSGTPVLRFGSDGCRTRVFGPDGRTLRCVDARMRVNVLSLHAVQDPGRLSDLRTSTEAGLSADGRTLIVQSFDTLDVYDALSREKRRSLPIGALESSHYALSNDGSLLADARGDGRLDLWDLRSGTKLRSLATGRKFVQEQPLAFSPDARTLATLTFDGENPTVLDFWDVASGTLRATSKGVSTQGYLGAGHSISGDPKVLFSPDGSTVVSALDQGVVEVATGERRLPPTTLESARAISADGVVAAAEEDTVRFWDGRTLTPGDGANIGSDPATMAFSRDGLLAVSDGAGRIRLYDVAGKRLLGSPLTGHYVDPRYTTISHARSLAFTPDSSHIVSTDAEGRVRADLIAVEPLRAALCARAGELTRAEWATYVPTAPYRSTC